MPKPKPIGPIKERPVCIVQIRPINAMHSNDKGHNLTIVRRVERFHGKVEPMGKITANPIIKGVNAILKNGGPTDNFRPETNSAISGHIVPISTTKQLVTNKRLLVTSADSLLTVLNTPLLSIEPARKANKSNDPPIKIVKMIRMNTPRSGSFANACTEVKTPDRTINVPISEKPKARIANKIVQVFKASLFSTTIAE